MREVLSISTVGEASLSAVVQTLLLRRADVVSLAAVRTGHEHALRIHVATDLADPASTNLLVKQLNRNIDVVTTARALPDRFHLRRGVMVRVRTDGRSRGQVLDLARAAGAEVIDVAATAMTLALFALPERVDNLLDLVRPFGIDEVTETGAVALRRSSRPGAGRP